MTDVNVVAIGDGLPLREPNVDLIERLEELLAEAKAGGISGMVYSCDTTDQMVCYGHAGSASFNLLSGVVMAQALLAREFAE